MEPFVRRIKNRIRGVVSIEFALGFFVLWVICMSWVEMSYMSYVSAICDVVLSESVREAKVNTEAYRTAFQTALANSGSLWGSLVDPNKFKLSIQYIDSVNELQRLVKPCRVPDGDSVFECGQETLRAIAVYRIEYDFQSVSTYLMDANSIFSREAIVIQEYERDAFKI
ncbi:pilus assembly protein TadE [Vibrio splendidus]|uniref:Pilus assembly protein TadE n=1 Tax=Vibrio lentus TaxID=136468 RepID=A0A855ISV0_9VIBR|nr:TadE family protein [Vibrio lentus]PHN83521.1 pilus assembly protein TadE [Vibrio splendidus]MCB5362014.1 pilus assembly protein [Vibrio lentus]MCB5452349.1 pilus assembly protein [Vibrio lentus]MCB5464382.1 pilus assembly protein [Vibrio lentus]MCB5464518.1 pilus assembly protein [Vibrio lentus]